MRVVGEREVSRRRVQDKDGILGYTESTPKRGSNWCAKTVRYVQQHVTTATP
jgi:hypothetical protein